MGIGAPRGRYRRAQPAGGQGTPRAKWSQAGREPAHLGGLGGLGWLAHPQHCPTLSCLPWPAGDSEVTAARDDWRAEEDLDEEVLEDAPPPAESCRAATAMAAAATTTAMTRTRRRRGGPRRRLAR